MALIRFDGGWQRDYAHRGFHYVAPGDYDDNVSIDTYAKFVSDREVRQLIPLLESEGFILPRLDERLRVEDLKITHRLLDLLDKGIQP